MAYTIQPVRTATPTRVPSRPKARKLTGTANALTRGKGKKKGLRKPRSRIGTALTVTKTPTGLKVRERK